VLSGCGSHQSESGPQNLARVGNQYLTIQQAKKEIPSFIYKQDSISALSQYRKQWIHEQLLLKEADKFELEQQQPVQDKIKQARQEVLKQALKTHIVTTEVDSTIAEQKIREYYDTHKKHFILQEPYVQFRHLQASNIQDARAARQALRDSLSWQEVAQMYAINPQQAISESNRYLPLSMAVSNINIMQSYLETIPVGNISAIQRANGVYHFVQLTDRRAGGEAPELSWLKDEIKSQMLREKRQRKFNSYLKNLYLSAESDNEITSYNVLSTQTNSKNSTVDTLERNSTDE
jgi:hypothetical protein